MNSERKVTEMSKIFRKDKLSNLIIKDDGPPTPDTWRKTLRKTRVPGLNAGLAQLERRNKCFLCEAEETTLVRKVNINTSNIIIIHPSHLFLGKYSFQN